MRVHLDWHGCEALSYVGRPNMLLPDSYGPFVAIFQIQGLFFSLVVVSYIYNLNAETKPSDSDWKSSETDVSVVSKMFSFVLFTGQYTTFCL